MAFLWLWWTIVMNWRLRRSPFLTPYAVIKIYLRTRHWRVLSLKTKGVNTRLPRSTWKMRYTQLSIPLKSEGHFRQCTSHIFANSYSQFRNKNMQGRPVLCPTAGGRPSSPCFFFWRHFAELAMKRCVPSKIKLSLLCQLCEMSPEKKQGPLEVQLYVTFTF